MALRITMALLIGLMASTSHAASGFFNMPTSLPQCLGCGWGPGYHAEMVLKPYYRTWNSSQGVVRAQPRDYPPIYNHRVARHYHAQAAPAPVYHSAPAYQSAPVYRSAPVYQPTPAASPMFSAPPVYHATPAKPIPKPEQVPAEPASPSDKSGEPDPLPMP